jgi:hypothetical protein
MQTKTEIQNEILSKMTPTEKIRLALMLYYSAWELKTGWLKQIHNDWSDNQIEQEVKRIFSNARS